MSLIVTNPIRTTLNLVHEHEESSKGETTVSREENIQAICTAGVPAELAANLDDKTLSAIREVVQTMQRAGGMKKMSETPVRKFSETQNYQRSLVYRHAAEHKADLAVFRETPASWVKRFEQRLAKNPDLTAAQFCCTKPEKVSAFAEKPAPSMESIAARAGRKYGGSFGKPDVLQKIFADQQRKQPSLTLRQFSESLGI